MSQPLVRCAVPEAGSGYFQQLQQQQQQPQQQQSATPLTYQCRVRVGVNQNGSIVPPALPPPPPPQPPPAPPPPTPPPLGPITQQHHDFIKRPMNAFMLWASHRRRQLAKKYPAKHNAVLSQILGEEWSRMSLTKKQPYIEAARKIREHHRLVLPDFKQAHQPKRLRSLRYTDSLQCISQISPHGSVTLEDIAAANLAIGAGETEYVVTENGMVVALPRARQHAPGQQIPGEIQIAASPGSGGAGIHFTPSVLNSPTVPGALHPPPPSPTILPGPPGGGVAVRMPTSNPVFPQQLCGTNLIRASPGGLLHTSNFRPLPFATPTPSSPVRVVLPQGIPPPTHLPPPPPTHLPGALIGRGTPIQIPGPHQQQQQHQVIGRNLITGAGLPDFPLPSGLHTASDSLARARALHRAPVPTLGPHSVSLVPNPIVNSPGLPNNAEPMVYYRPSLPTGQIQPTVRLQQALPDFGPSTQPAPLTATLPQVLVRPGQTLSNAGPSSSAVPIPFSAEQNHVPKVISVAASEGYSASTTSTPAQPISAPSSLPHSASFTSAALRQGDVQRSDLTLSKPHNPVVLQDRSTHNTAVLQDNSAVLQDKPTHNPAVLQDRATHNTAVLQDRVTHNTAVLQDRATHNPAVVQDKSTPVLQDKSVVLQDKSVHNVQDSNAAVLQENPAKKPDMNSILRSVISQDLELRNASAKSSQEAARLRSTSKESILKRTAVVGSLQGSSPPLPPVMLQTLRNAQSTQHCTQEQQRLLSNAESAKHGADLTKQSTSLNSANCSVRPASIAESANLSHRPVSNADPANLSQSPVGNTRSANLFQHPVRGAESANISQRPAGNADSAKRPINHADSPKQQRPSPIVILDSPRQQQSPTPLKRHKPIPAPPPLYTDGATPTSCAGWVTRPFPKPPPLYSDT